MTVSCSRDQVSANIFEIIIASEKANHLVELVMVMVVEKANHLVEVVGNFWIGACARFIRDRMMGGAAGDEMCKGGIFFKGGEW